MPGTDDLMLGLHELAEARDTYDDAWAFWRGDRDEEFSSPAVRRALRRSRGRYVVNIAKMPVQAVAHRLKIAALAGLDVDGNKDEAADAALQAMLAGQRMTTTWKILFRNTLIYGDGYLYVWKGDSDGTCHIAYNDPTVARVIYDPKDSATALYGIKRWVDRSGALRATLSYPDHLETGWVLKACGTEDVQGGWERSIGDEDVPNPWGGLPLRHFRTDLPYGRPLAEDVWGSQDAVNKISTTMTHTTEAAGFRERWALTDPMAALTGDAADSPDWDDDADADVRTEDDSRVRGGAGELNILAGIKAVGEWSAANAQAFLDPADFYIRMSAAIGGFPMHYIDQRGQAPSGESLRVADAPLLATVDDLQETLNADTADAMSFALAVLGFPDRRVDVRWKAPGIIDDMTTWTIAQAKIGTGVPPKVALSETGLYEPDEIESWLSEAAVEMDVARRVTILGQVATAIAGLGQGVALGLLTESQAQAVIETTIGQLTPEIETGTE